LCLTILLENRKDYDFDVKVFLAREEAIQDVLLSYYWFVCDKVLQVSSGDVGIHEFEETIGIVLVETKVELGEGRCDWCWLVGDDVLGP
jgi:hypothetical protein